MQYQLGTPVGNFSQRERGGPETAIRNRAGKLASRRRPPRNSLARSDSSALKGSLSMH